MTSARGLVLGCGGPVGFAWSIGALTALERELGWDARTAEAVVGTSAGGELAALLGAGFSLPQLLAALEGDAGAPRLATDHLAATPPLLPALPGRGLTAPALATRLRDKRIGPLAAVAGLLPRGRSDAGWLRDLGAALAAADSWVAHDRTWIVAADRATGDRVAFGAPGSPQSDLGSALAATWAVPAFYPPVEIAGIQYVDGGVVSPTSADLLLPLGFDEVVVVAPMSTAGGASGRGLSRLERVVRRAMTRRVDREVDLLEAAGTRVVRIEPGEADLEVMGFNFTDHRRRAATLERALTTSPARVRTALKETVR